MLTVELQLSYGDTRIFECLNGKVHGKRVVYHTDGKITNEIWRNGTKIAHKYVKKEEAYFTSTGKI